MREIKFLDLTNPPESVLEAVQEVAKSGWYVSGPQVERFERLWASFCGAAYCVACGSGGDAITLAIKALNPPPGARIVIPALTFAASAMAALEAGTQPIYCDVDEHGLMNLEDAAHVAETERAWGIMPVHLYGQLVDMERVMEIAVALRLRVIEDAAQAHGSITSVSGDAACFSFYPGKNLGAFGEAGAVVTNNEATANLVQAIANYGVLKGKKYDHLLLGGNRRMDEIQAAVLATKLPFLGKWNARRQAIAGCYENAGVPSFVKGGNYHLYPVKVSEPMWVRAKMKAAGIATGQHYPTLLPEQPPLFMPGNWPMAVTIARHHLTLPMGPHLSDDDVAYAARKFLEVTK